MDKIKIAFLQISPESDIERSLNKGMEACYLAKKHNADIALFPEMYSSGYNLGGNLDNRALEASGSFVQAFKALSEELNMAICITFLEKHRPKPLNSLILFDRYGNAALKYSKVHTCIFGDEEKLSAGEEFFTASLNTAKRKYRSRCHDLL